MSVTDDLEYLRRLIKQGEMLSVWESLDGQSEFNQWLDSLCSFREATTHDYRIAWLKFQDSTQKNNLRLERIKGNHRTVSANWKSEAGTISYLLRNVLFPEFEAKLKAPAEVPTPVQTKNITVSR